MTPPCATLRSTWMQLSSPPFKPAKIISASSFRLRLGTPLHNSHVNNSSLLQYRTFKQWSRAEEMFSGGLKFISTPTVDTPGTSMVLTLQQSNYYFGNFPEGTQRILQEGNVRVIRISNLFLTGKVDTSNTSGLIGLLLSMGDVQKSIVDVVPKRRSSIGERSSEKIADRTTKIHGARNLKRTLTSARAFIYRKKLKVAVHEYEDTGVKDGGLTSPDWKDDYLNIWMMPLHSSTSKQPISSPKQNGSGERKRSFEEMSTGHTSSQQNVSTTDEIDLGSQSNCYDEPSIESDQAVVDDVGDSTPPRAESCLTSMSYVVMTNPQRGKFLVEKAKSLGVKPGPDFTKLTTGEDVILEDSTVVKAEDCLGPHKPAKAFAIIEVPSEDYIESLVQRPEWSCEDLVSKLEVIIWNADASVINNKIFRQFIDGLAPVKHIVSSMDFCPNHLAYEKSASASMALYQLDRNHTLKPLFQNKAVLEIEPSYSKVEQNSESITNWQPAVRGLDLRVYPELRIERKGISKPLTSGSIISQLMGGKGDRAREHFEARLDEVRLEHGGSQLGPEETFADTEIICLGTGSALPSARRNVSATLLRRPSYGSYLFDVGEGTLGQLRRSTSPRNLKSLLRDLKTIWISHNHADHFLGLLEVVRARSEACKAQSKATDQKPKLTIVASRDIAYWILQHGQMQDLGLENVEFLELEHMDYVPNKNPGIHELNRISTDGTVSRLEPQQTKDVLSALDLSQLMAVNTSHCPDAKCLSVVFNDGFKVSYSGDTRPSKDFVDIGKGSHVLIHEATLEDELQADAKFKKHSTTSEAIAVAAAMGVKNLLLTHFSQRYFRVPVIEESSFEHTEMESFQVKHVPGSDTSPPSQERILNWVSVPISQQAIHDMRIVYAYDFMRLNVGDFPYLSEAEPLILMRYIQLQLDAEETAFASGTSSAAKVNSLKISKKKLSKAKQGLVDEKLRSPPASHSPVE